ncbi:Serine incorporator (Serinc) [Novymonas esmeraldas]|uniref:Serine incorporator (Serinc) n=1 Tax=Novymonas esmeraldas TaxID=1808958 RepID=A0AAW0F3Z2_9TRYP
MSDADDGLLSRQRFRSVDEDSDLSPSLIIRLSYAMYLFVALLLSMMARGLMSSLFEKVPLLERGCATNPQNGVIQAACGAEMLIYRVSFALVVFFAFHWITVSDLTCCIRSKDRAELQRSFFTVKTVLLVLLFIATLFIPNGFFAGYAYVCLICSGLYLLMNVVFLVDFSYHWSDEWGERADGNPKWMWYLLAIAVGSLTLAVAAIVASFVIYVPHSDCNYNAGVITSVIVGAFVYLILSIYVPHGSIVPSSIVFLYTSCILFFTLRTTGNEHCNRMATRSTSTAYSIFQTIATMVLTSFTLLYSVVAAGGSSAALNIGQDDDGDLEDADETGHLSHYMFFYTIMIFGSMYLAMLGSSWHVSGAGDDGLSTSINIAFWVRMSTVWAAMILYIWSLVAPYTCCKGRDFGFAVDEDWV